MGQARRLARLLSFGVVAGLSGCTSDETLTAYLQENATYRLTSLDGVRVAGRTVLEASGPAELAGQTPCNTFTAGIEAPYPWFELGPIRTTRRACPGLAEEERVLRALRTARFAEAQGGVLILTGADGAELVFEAE